MSLHLFVCVSERKLEHNGKALKASLLISVIPYANKTQNREREKKQEKYTYTQLPSFLSSTHILIWRGRKGGGVRDADFTEYVNCNTSAYLTVPTSTTWNKNNERCWHKSWLDCVRMNEGSKLWHGRSWKKKFAVKTNPTKSFFSLS